MKKHILTLLTIQLLAIGLFHGNAEAQAVFFNNKIAVQGYLKQGASPLVGSYNMQFQVVQNGATIVWCQSASSVNITNGIFNQVLSGNSNCSALVNPMSPLVFTAAANSDSFQLSVVVDLGTGFGAGAATFSGIDFVASPLALIAASANYATTSGTLTMAGTDGNFLKHAGGIWTSANIAVSDVTGLSALLSTGGSGSIGSGGTPIGNVYANTITVGGASISNTGGGTITAASFTGALTGNVTGNVSGSAVSFTGALVGDVSGTQGATVVAKINGVSMSGLATGVLKNTTATGVPSIAVAGTDYLVPAGSAAISTSHVSGVTASAGAFTSGSAIGSAGSLVLMGGAGGGTFTINPSTVGAAQTWTLPVTAPAAGQYLQSTNTTGTLSWAAPTVANFTGSLAGDVTGTQGATSVSAATVTGKVLAGYSSATGTVAATDSILAAIQKLNGNSLLLSPIASPTFTGTPAAPTAAANTNTTQVATTAFVIGQASSTTPVVDGTAAIGVGTTFARGDHVHPTDATRAALASPSFTGTPAAPTAAANTNTTQVATTAFVIGQASATTPVVDGTAAIGVGTTFARGDHVHPTDATRAPAASPTLTGTVTLPGTGTWGASGVGIGSAASALLTLGAGTAAANTSPLKMTTGVLQTTAEAGAHEYDGNAFYASPVASNRAVIPVSHYITQTTAYACTASTANQKMFNASAAGQITLPAATSYEFESTVSITRVGAGAGTLSFLFGGTATITSIGYSATCTNGANTVAGGATTTVFGNIAAATAVTAAATAPVNTCFIKGIVRINATGTFIPQFAFSVAPATSCSMAQNSYFKLIPIGNGTAATIGNWN